MRTFTVTTPVLVGILAANAALAVGVACIYHAAHTPAAAPPDHVASDPMYGSSTAAKPAAGTPAASSAQPTPQVIVTTDKDLLTTIQQSEAADAVKMKNESLSEALGDTGTTADRYHDKKIQITGTVTGIFIPSYQQSLQMAMNRPKGFWAQMTGEQGGADSFITMGGPYAASAEDTLLKPGIRLNSAKGDSLQPTFGQPSLESLAGRLVVGQEATLLCTFDEAASDPKTGVSITLDDCTLGGEAPQQEQTPQAATTAHAQYASAQKILPFDYNVMTMPAKAVTEPLEPAPHRDKTEMVQLDGWYKALRIIHHYDDGSTRVCIIGRRERERTWGQFVMGCGAYAPFVGGSWIASGVLKRAHMAAFTGSEAGALTAASQEAVRQWSKQ